MTKLEKFLEGVEKLRTPQNTKKIDALIEGTNLIASEYRKRKAKEEKARLEAEGFKKLDQHRIDSGLSNKAFIEGVGKTIIESNQPDDVKEKLMESLDMYAKYLTESESVSGCVFGLEPMDEQAKELLSKNDINGLLHKYVLPKDTHKYGDAATARKAGVEKVATDNGTPIDGVQYTISRKLIDTDHEKLFVLSAEGDANKLPYILHYADTPSAPL